MRRKCSLVDASPRVIRPLAVVAHHRGNEVAVTVLQMLGSSWTSLAAVLVATVGGYLWVVLLTRVAGPRSLAKMSGFDFAATVAVGSTLASTALGSTPLATGVLVLLLLYGLQFTAAKLRRRNALAGLIDSRPLLLMDGPTILAGNLRHARVSDEDLWAQLRQAGVHHRDEVYAVILERTGDMTVLTADGRYDPELLRGVRGAQELPAVSG